MGRVRRRRTGLGRPGSDERGATALLTAFLSLALLASAALGVDIAMQVMEKQKLTDTLDMAAHAGAYELPGNGAGAAAAALAMANANDFGADPVVDLWCVVAATGTPKAPNAAQIPSTCNPGTAPFTAARYPGLRCNNALCAIPCVPAQGDMCNTVRVADSKVVPFAFGPAVGTPEGSTGNQVSVACKGSCGAELPNPMDVVVVADRTPSMSDANRGQMQQGMKAMLQGMQPSQHYVAFSALHKSKSNPGAGHCKAEDTEASEGATAGTWIPVGFSNNYWITPPSGATPPALNQNSELVKVMSCLPASSRGGFGTHLAGALKAASRYLLGYTTNNLSSLPARQGTPRKAIIFETDGMPDEIVDGGTTSLTSSGDIGEGRNYYGNGNGVDGCENMETVAGNAKAAGILVVTIGFGDANSASCEKPVTSSGSNRTPRRTVGAELPRGRRLARPDDQPGERRRQRLLDDGASGSPRTATATSTSAPRPAPSSGPSSGRRSPRSAGPSS